MSAMTFFQRVRIPFMILLSSWLLLGGCRPCAQEARELQEIIERGVQSAAKTCQSLEGVQERDACYHCVAKYNLRLQTIPAQYKIACHNDNATLMRDLQKMLLDSLAFSCGFLATETPPWFDRTEPGAAHGVVNAVPILPRDESITLDITARPTSGVGDGSPGSMPTRWDILGGSTVTVHGEWGTLPMTAAGWLTTEGVHEDSGAITLTSLHLVLGAGDATVTLILPDSAAPVVVTLDRFGRGVVEVVVALETDLAMVALPAVSLRLPIVVDDARIMIALTTQGEEVDAWSVVPVSPWPVADYDDDGDADATDIVSFLEAAKAQDPTADADRSGTVDGADLAYFMEYWSASQLTH
jgi:hypothetical protein